MLAIASALALCFAACRRDAGTPTGVAARIDAIFAGYADASKPGCVVGVALRGTPVFVKAFGLASVESGLPLTPQSTFNVGSISKQFTAFAALLLADRGRLSPDDAVRRHLPELRDYGTPIRIRDLMHHTSGLRDIHTLEDLAGRQNMTMAQALELASRQRALNFTPGTKHEYSHMDYVLLALVIERVAGEPLGVFLEREIFTPLGMTSTRLFDSRRVPSPNRALSHTLAGESYRVGFPATEVVGGNNLYTSVEDFLKWEANLHTAAVGGRAVVDRLLERPALPSGEPIPYANGLRRGEHRGLRTILRGASGGYASEMVRFPDQGLMVMTMCNVVPAEPYRLGVEVAELFIGAQMAPTPALLKDESLATPAEELVRYAGTYRPVEVPWDLVYIHAHDGALHERLPEGPVKLSRRRDGTFVAEGIVYTFSPPSNGRPGRLTLAGLAPPGWSEVLDHVPNRDAWRPDARALAAFEGTYFSEDLAVVWRIGVRDGAAIVQRVGLPDVPLKPVSPDLFTGQIQAIESRVRIGLRFLRVSGGHVAAFTVSTPPQQDHVRDVRFDRR